MLPLEAVGGWLSDEGLECCKPAMAIEGKVGTSLEPWLGTAAPTGSDFLKFRGGLTKEVWAS